MMMGAAAAQNNPRISMIAEVFLAVSLWLLGRPVIFEVIVIGLIWY